MSEEADYEGLPSNAGFTVRLIFFVREVHLTHPYFTTRLICWPALW